MSASVSGTLPAASALVTWYACCVHTLRVGTRLVVGVAVDVDAAVASRGDAAQALVAIGRDAARAEALEPHEFVALTRGARVRASAPAKINLALVVGPLRKDGKHELLTMYQRIGIADRIDVEPAEHTRVDGFAGDTLVRDALELLAAHAAVDQRWHAKIEKHIPVAAGLGGGSSDAATALRLANETLDEPLPPEELHDVAARLGADVPFFLVDGPQLGSGDGTMLAAIDLPQDFWIVLVLPNDAQKPSTASVYAAFDERNGADGWDDRRNALLDALDRVKRPRDLAALPRERPRVVAARRRADRARRVPRRRQRRRPDRLRPLPSRGSCEGREACAAPGRADLADCTSVVRLTRAERLSARRRSRLEQGRLWLQERRTRLALWIAAAESLLVLFSHNLTKWTVIALAIVAVLAWLGGRESRSADRPPDPLDLRRLAAPGRDRRDPRLDREMGRDHGRRDLRGPRARLSLPRPPLEFAVALGRGQVVRQRVLVP